MSKRAVILIVAALIAVTAAVFFLRDPDPQAVLRQATAKLLAEKTFHVDLRATLIGLPKEIGSGVVAGATGVDMIVQSDIDRTDPLKQASVSTFEFRQGLVSGGEAVIAGEARRKDGVHYLRLQSLQGVQGVEASRIVGVWMKANRPFLDLLLATGAPTRPLDAAGFETVKSGLRNVDIFHVVRKLPKESVAGAKSFHYSVEMNMETVSALLLKQRELRTGKAIDAEDILAVTEELIRWGKPVGEIWIDVKTRKLKQITLGTALGQDGASGAAAGTLVFSNEGKKVSVEIPDAQDIEKVLGPLFDKRLNLSGGRALAQAPSKTQQKETLSVAPDAALQEKDTDSDGLSDTQEFFYGADAWNTDTDGDGYADGFEVDKGMNPAGPGTLFSFGL